MFVGKIWEHPVLAYFPPLLLGCAVIALFSAAMSAVCCFLFRSVDMLPVFAVAALALGGYCSGLFCGKYRRRRGLSDGLICGGALFAVLFIFGLIMGSLPGAKQLIILTVSGGIGGVVGVNKKAPWLSREL